MPDEKKVLTIEEVSAELGIGRSTAYQLAKERKIPAIRLGRRYVVPKAAFERFLENAGTGKSAA